MPVDGSLLAGAVDALIGTGGWIGIGVLLGSVLLILGVLDGLFGSESEEPDAEASDGDDPGAMFADTEDDEALSFDDDDPFGGEEFAEGDDEFDDLGSETDVGDLEVRVDQLEQELSDLSSTVSTVRTENEQISETVEDIEDNVRKLLDIYKMVTKGVNPFVDQQSGGFSGTVDDDSLGLFQDDDEPEEANELDEEIMEADAEEFFDDDFEGEVNTEPADDGDTTGGAVESVDDEFEPLEEGVDAEPETAEGGARSFDDLKEEYDEQEAFEMEPAESETETTETPAEPATTDTTDDPTVEPDPDPAPTQTAETSPQPADSTPTSEAETFQPPSDPKPPEARQPLAPPEGARPYLETLPDGFTEELLVLEWVEFLVTESSPQDAYSTVTYYERIGWIGESAGERLRTLIRGHPEADRNLRGSGGPSGLSVEHHLRSLDYVAQLNGAVAAPGTQRALRM